MNRLTLLIVIVTWPQRRVCLVR